MRRPRHAHAPESGEAGFALAEALVAFAILALVSLAMMRAFAGTTAAWSAVSARETRLEIAARLLEQARAAEPVRPGRREGAEGEWVWWQLIEPVESAGLPPPAGTPRLFRVSVGVALKSKPTPALLTTLILARGADGA